MSKKKWVKCRDVTTWTCDICQRCGGKCCRAKRPFKHLEGTQHCLCGDCNNQTNRKTLEGMNE